MVLGFNLKNGTERTQSAKILKKNVGKDKENVEMGREE